MKTFKELAKKEGPVLGLYMNFSDPAVVEMAKLAGFDFIRVDYEHILFDYKELKELVRTATLLDMPCQVRVSNIEDITKLIDQGVTGIVVPDVDTVERAREAVAATKMYPLGKRGQFPIGRFVRLAGCSTFQEYAQIANDIVTLNIQIEDKKAIPHLDQIISLPGVDMVSSGKGDISQSMGKPGQLTDPEVLAMEDLLIKKALQHGKIPLMLAASPEFVKSKMAMGAKFFSVGPDEILLLNAFKDFVKKYQDLR
ncbi:MAG: hypothetical protein J6H20_08135 [Pyramidobacter sp.]|nr:hypothetical protein [Pyramidobacter sp.]MBP3752580.1 hypothetical protein [Pyramidobacter sp.]